MDSLVFTLRLQQLFKIAALYYLCFADVEQEAEKQPAISQLLSSRVRSSISQHQFLTTDTSPHALYNGNYSVYTAYRLVPKMEMSISDSFSQFI